MRRFFIMFLVFGFSLPMFSQINYEPGYIINENGSKTECLIKNIDWKDNPTRIKYKMGEDADSRYAELKETKEFAIYDGPKFIREKVKINRTSDHVINKMDSSPNPEFKEETIFLKVLIEGEISLYSYVDERLTRFYYSTPDSDIEPLIYKRYIDIEEMKVGANELFKQQLFNMMKCEGLTINRFMKLSYLQSDLMKIYEAYYDCTNKEFTQYVKKKKQIFNFTIRPGIDLTAMSMDSRYLHYGDINFDRELSFRFGFEMEYILPFNKKKWGFFIESTYQYYKTKLSKSDPSVGGGILNSKVDYSTLSVPIGIRHYFYFNDQSKMFLNTGVMFHKTFKSEAELLNMDYQSLALIDVEVKIHFLLGAGYKLNDKYSFELRYLNGSRKLSFENAGWTAKMNSIELVFGYTL